MKKYSLLMIALLVVATVTMISCKKKDDPKPNNTKVDSTNTPDNPTEKITISVEAFTAETDENPEADASLGTVSAKASDGKAKLEYMLEGQSVEGALKIDASTGEVMVADPAKFDFETVQTITAKCVVKSGDVQNSADMTITIKNVSEAFVIKLKANTYSTYEISKSADFLASDDYDVEIDWGDGTKDQNVLGHKYSEEKEYTIAISGKFPALELGKNFATGTALITVVSWGDNEWKSMKNMFKNTNIATFEATDQPNITSVTSLEGCFDFCKNFNDGSINDWDVSKVTSMKYTFSYCEVFNQPLDKWNTENVTDMTSMFNNAKEYSQDLTGWNVDAVGGYKYFGFARNSKLKCDQVPAKFDKSFSNCTE